MKAKYAKTILTLAILCLFTSPLYSQAYCALRDPVSAIGELYPEADSYRSIVRTVNESTRSTIAQELPFTIHFNELGRHTLYVTALDARPVGLVHVRSEAGTWGLAEIAWALTSNLTVRDFVFQRCRSRAKRELETDSFRGRLVGKGRDELRALLDQSGDSLAPGSFPDLSEEARNLAVTVIRSSLKTIEVTRFAWKEDIELLRILDHVYTAFPEGSTVELFENLYDDAVIAQIEKQTGQISEPNIARDLTKAIRVRDQAGTVLGHVIRTPWSSSGHEAVLWWNVSADLVIERIIPESDWPNEEVEDAFSDVEETSISNISHCQTAAQIIGAEVLLVSERIGKTK